MKLWMGRNPRSFGDTSVAEYPKPDWYGWEGDNDICAVVVAESAEAAAALMEASLAEIKGFLYDHSEWEWTELTVSDGPRMVLFAYGSY